MEGILLESPSRKGVNSLACPFWRIDSKMRNQAVPPRHQAASRKNSAAKSGRASISLLDSLESRWLFAFNPTGREQELMEYLNRFRANPVAEYNLVANSSDATVNGAIAFFSVNKAVLLQQFNALKAVPPLAWNAALTTAALAHNNAMLSADEQTHQAPGEPDLPARVNTAGYTGWANIGENVYAYSTSTFYAHAAFAIDWGTGPNGIQDPAGHRNNMLSSIYREVGINMLDDTLNKPKVGPTLVTQDFGVRSGQGNPWLLGTLWKDNNSNGYYTAGEGLGGATVKIVGTGGTFTTSSLTAGAYQVQVPAGTYTITVSGGAFASPVSSTVTVGSVNVKKDFKYTGTTTTPTGSVTGNVYDDLSGDGVKQTGEANLSGWTVYIDANSNSKLDTGEKSTTTNSSGVYTLSGLTAGTYRVATSLKTGYRWINPSTGYLSVAVASGATASAKNFGASSRSKITGQLWNDVNANGVKDSTEVYQSGWKVYLDANVNGKFDTGEVSTTTNSSGVYTFNGLAAGTYRVREVVNAGYRNNYPTANYYSIVVGAGQNWSGKNFGNTTMAKWSGKLFNDTDADKIKDSTEAYLSGWTVYVDANNNGKLDTGETSVLTDSTGGWSFNLAAGTKYVRVVLKTGYKFTTPTTGVLSATLTAGQTKTDGLFGTKLI